MNPLPMLMADLKALRWIAWTIVVLVALSVGFGVALQAQERAVRKSSAHAADDFDLLIGAPGSATQLMLSAIYVQPEALPLLESSVVQEITTHPGVQNASPIAWGDFAKGVPILGVSPDFVTRWGRVKLASGRVFSAQTEAVIGAEVDLPVGTKILPQHGARSEVQAHPFAAGSHENFAYTVVGRLPRFGSPWDKTILVPIESLWALHAGTTHAGREPSARGAPAVVVKPASIAAAYALRAHYRSQGLMAIFPAEVLVGLYRTMGDMRDVLLIGVVLNVVLIFAAILLLLLALNGLRRQRYAILRALGAPRRYILLLVWLNASTLLGAGCLLGLVFGGLISYALSAWVSATTGLRLVPSIELSDATLPLALMGVATLLSLAPALMSYRSPVIAGLRQG